MDNYRQLQKSCEHQAALSSSPATRTVLLEMAEEYRKRAEYKELQAAELRAQDDPRGVGMQMITNVE
ncbi:MULTISPECIES: hypothetical protein [Bradyrhizobium]|nr:MULTISPECIES: hypothetical protein [Bradyrhizobium]